MPQYRFIVAFPFALIMASFVTIVECIYCANVTWRGVIERNVHPLVSLLINVWMDPVPSLGGCNTKSFPSNTVCNPFLNELVVEVIMWVLFGDFLYIYSTLIMGLK